MFNFFGISIVKTTNNNNKGDKLSSFTVFFLRKFEDQQELVTLLVQTVNNDCFGAKLLVSIIKVKQLT